MRTVFEGDLIPKNPYPICIRSLDAMNIQKESSLNFRNIIKFSKKNLTEIPKDYGITTTKIKSRFYGVHQLLEWFYLITVMMRTIAK